MVASLAYRNADGKQPFSDPCIATTTKPTGGPDLQTKFNLHISLLLSFINGPTLHIYKLQNVEATLSMIANTIDGHYSGIYP